MSRVFVAMSGGVDSSVTAALLVEAGHDVTGVTMRLMSLEDADSGCCSADAARDAKRVCDLLGIAHYTLDFETAFETDVLEPFAAQYALGLTPNPCIACNDLLKFSELMRRVHLQGAEFLATGHYARISPGQDGAPTLMRAVDATKDQSYFLYRMTREQLSRTLFPLGEMRKDDVRAHAAALGLKVASKPDSQDVCFSVDGSHAPVVAKRHPEAYEPGEIVTVAGDLVGRHDGIANFTVGQRKGLGIGGLSEPLYVVSIDAQSRRVVVGGKADVTVREVVAHDVVWHGPSETSVDAMVRYRMQARPARAQFDGTTLRCAFDEPLDSAAPGQSLVCYRGEAVIGGGTIQCVS